ncbi:MAG: hypothetical protein HUU38_13575 [Anaerolineales bacterium]|nr:hypothetical protein [Anaerolineales bacterium]
MDKTLVQAAVRRGIIILAISFGFVFAFSEIAYQLTRSDVDRDPQEVLLLIPAGTGEKVAQGEAEPSIPEEMTFVIGDTLTVKNEDNIDHQLGSLFIPAGTSASLPLQQAANLEYECSFQPSQLFGLTVRQQATFNFRFFAIAYATPATAIFIFVYSLAVSPLKKKEGG